MIDLVPERVLDTVVLTAHKFCNINRYDCRSCGDAGVAVHNWLMGAELNYVIIDLQDEKEICPTFLVELIQLRKRLQIPFMFVGVMERAKRVLDEYNFTVSDWPVLSTPEEAIEYLRGLKFEFGAIDDARVGFGQVLLVSRSRNGLRGDGEGVELEGDVVDDELDVED